MKNALFWILLAAAVLRFWGIGWGDAWGDEVFYAFRAIGMIDFLNSEDQTTPWEWHDPSTGSGQAIPFWAKFSFHDHPPLVFLAQNFSMGIFGESHWAFRLPGTLLGIASVYLIYLIASLLFSRRAAIVSTLLMAVTFSAADISRTGLQEPYAIFFILLTLYFYLKSLGATGPYSAQGSGKYLVLAGVALGLGMLAKYTVFAAAVIIFFHILIFRRDILRQRHFWYGALAALLIFSPVIIYNIGLYLSAGHFDFQFSYFFGQDPEVWKVAPGKEAAGSFSERILNFIPDILAINSWLFLAVAAVSLIFLRSSFLALALVFTAAELLLIGTASRFAAMLTPFLVLSCGAFFDFLAKRFSPKIFAVIAAIFVSWEVIYAANSALSADPLGWKPWTYSKISIANYNWGFNQLDDYLTKELKGKMPSLRLNLRYKFLTDEQNLGLQKAAAKGLEAVPALIVYDRNINDLTQLWIFARRQIYHGWPILTTEGYLSLKNPEAFKKIYFVAPGEVPLGKPEQFSNLGAAFEEELKKNGIFPVSIENTAGEEAFRAYNWDF